MRTLITITFFLFVSAVHAQPESQFYDGYRRYDNQTDRTVRQNVNEDDVLSTGTAIQGARAYKINPRTGRIIVPPSPPGSGVVVMSDAHLDPKKFLDWIDGKRSIDSDFMRTYEGVNFRKFMDDLPNQIKANNASGKPISSMDIVWGGDPFDRKAFEKLSLEDRKRAFREFAKELKRMESVDGVKYNFIASLGDHEVGKVNSVWDNKTAYKAASVNDPKLSTFLDDSIKKLADEQLVEMLKKGEKVTVPIYEKTPSGEFVKKGEKVIEDLQDFRKDAVKARKAFVENALREWPDDATKADDYAKAKKIAEEKFASIKANPPKPIDIPKITVTDDISNLGKGMAKTERAALFNALTSDEFRLSNGKTVLQELKDIGKGGVLDPSGNPLHRELVEKYGQIFDSFDEIVGGGKPASDQLKARRQAGVLNDFLKTDPVQITAEYGEIMKQRGLKPPAAARGLNGIDDQLEISKYSRELSEVLEQEGMRVDRTTFSPYEATVQTGADGKQYAHRHVQYGNLDNALLEKPQMDAIIKNNTSGSGSRIKLPEVRVELDEKQLQRIEELTGKKPDGLPGRGGKTKYTITDEMFEALEKKAAGTGSVADEAKKFLSTGGDDALLKGQHTVAMASDTADGMRKAKIVVPGRTDVLENAGQQSIKQHLQAEDGRIVQNHSKTTQGRSSAGDIGRINNMDDGAVLFTSDTHNPSMNLAAATDPDTARMMDQLCPGCVGTRPEINSGSMSASAKNPGRPNTIAIQFGDEPPRHLAIDPDTGKVVNFDAVPKEQREWLKGLREAQDAGDDAFVKYLLDHKTGADPLTPGKSMLGDDAVDALRKILPCK